MKDHPPQPGANAAFIDLNADRGAQRTEPARGNGVLHAVYPSASSGAAQTPAKAVDSLPRLDAVTGKPPMVAAKGDDELMGQQQQASPVVDQIKGKWKQQMGAAKIAWGKLTDDELLKLEGHEQKLAGLVQQRYGVTREGARMQVRTFFDKHMT
jgi:uncharacterized protein YjbJ (UPF0337 family)